MPTQPAAWSKNKRGMQDRGWRRVGELMERSTAGEDNEGRMEGRGRRERKDSNEEAKRKA